MSPFARDYHEYGLRFTGPLLLVPLWRAYGWWVSRWIVHDCDRQPITCRLPATFQPFDWITERWVTDTDTHHSQAGAEDPATRKKGAERSASS